ncbi:magnesium transporter MgtE [Lederbergia ruris]|uniref:Magnesium transporter MgtE n=1 Tax=Lederbergia ruris TaxID=217495 RepID=A0ABQ4KM76_9BACI|nr:magnesium transporter [Lederbergia ruris]GIN59037.1 magnesium transporter MgtE [Lederbergia ruris]
MLSDRECEQLALEVVEYMNNEKFNEVNDLLKEKHPYNLSVIFQSLPEKYRAPFLEHLEDSMIASIMKKLSTMQQMEALGKIGPEKANKILTLLDGDILAHLLKVYPDAHLKRYLSGLGTEQSAFIQKKLGYPDGTAGRLMSNQYIALQESLNVEEAILKARELAFYSESLHYIYLLNENKQLTGIIAYRDLVIAAQDEKLKDIMNRQMICVSALTKRAELARLLQRYDLSALPVLDEESRLIGVIKFEDIVKVLIHEASEDYGKFSTASKEIDFQTKPLTATLRRLPWLVALLFIGLVSGSIIAKFEGTLEQVVALAFFMPLIAGMTGNTGTQSLAVVVRGLAEQEVGLKKAAKLLLREAWAGVLIGIICGLSIAVIAYIWQGNIYLGIVVGGSLLLTLIIGTLAGTIIPLLLYKFGIDPAVASGPLITTINDIFSLFIFPLLLSFWIN